MVLCTEASPLSWAEAAKQIVTKNKFSKCFIQYVFDSKIEKDSTF